MQPRRGGVLRAKGPVYAWNGSWPECDEGATCLPTFQTLHLWLRRLIVDCSSQLFNAKLMSYVIYLLTSPPLRAPSVLGRIISSCPLKTIETSSLEFFPRPSAPLRTARSCLCLVAKRLFQRLTTITYFV